ncbi:MAG: hypothetical protein ACR2GX_04255 [Candidatus Dormibacteria bacterium]
MALDADGVGGLLGHADLLGKRRGLATQSRQCYRDDVGMALDLPDLPEAPSAQDLEGLDEEGLVELSTQLTAWERDTITAMSPYDRRLRELRARAGQINTERRRRERAAHVAARAAIRDQARAGTLPTLIDALAEEPSPFAAGSPLGGLHAHLATGGEVGFGYPNRPGQIAFSDGRQMRSASTWGEARQLWADGWEPGSPGVPGVRIHLAGSRVERVVAAAEIVVAAPG